MSKQAENCIYNDNKIYRQPMWCQAPHVMETLVLDVKCLQKRTSEVLYRESWTLETQLRQRERMLRDFLSFQLNRGKLRLALF